MVESRCGEGVRDAERDPRRKKSFGELKGLQNSAEGVEFASVVSSEGGDSLVSAAV